MAGKNALFPWNAIQIFLQEWPNFFSRWQNFPPGYQNSPLFHNEFPLFKEQDFPPNLKISREHGS